MLHANVGWLIPERITVALSVRVQLLVIACLASVRVHLHLLINQPSNSTVKARLA